ncbi:MAG: patatin-like phospholipase family protein [Chitinophagales bacterium]|nr:patatin-like phospholipase family protein [Chitinophagales bacterium]
MKHLGISGGGTKISGLFGAAEIMLTKKNYKPDIISGISAGAVLSVPLALGKMEEIKEVILSLTLNTFFNVPPVRKNGKLRLTNALSKLIQGQHYLGEQFNLEVQLKKMVSREEFDAYRKNDDLAICIVGAVDFYTGRRFFVNLKEVEYDLFPSLVNASASIPIFTPGILLSGPIDDFEGNTINHDMLLFDGGVRDHNPTHRILSSNKYNITESASIFSRPEDNQLLPNNCKPRNLLKLLGRYTDITSTEISKDDEFREKQYFQSSNTFNHGTFFLPSIMKDVYDVDKTRLRQLYEAGRQIVDNNWNVGVIA